MTSLHITILFFSMVFFHILDDYVLQGILASMKQKSWWKENYPNELYKKDWKIALCTHAFSWSFMIHVPLFVFLLWFEVEIPAVLLIATVIVNLIIHAITDHYKANKLRINLTTDQLIHLSQITATCCLYTIVAIL